MADQGITHELKTDRPVFKAVAQGRKTFEIRKDDRSFCVGDTLRLRETVHTGKEMSMRDMPLLYTGAEEVRTISHILRGPQYGLADGWVIMSLEPPKATPPADAALGFLLSVVESQLGHAADVGAIYVAFTRDETQRIAAALRARPDAEIALAASRDWIECLYAVGALCAYYGAMPARAGADGFVVANVKNLEVLVVAIERAESKGYLPDAIADAWAEFDYRLLAASKGAT